MDILKSWWNDHSTNLLTIIMNDLPQDFVYLDPLGYQESQLQGDGGSFCWVEHVKCGGLNKSDDPCRLIYNALSSVDKLGRMRRCYLAGAGVALEELYHWEWSVSFQKPTPGLVPHLFLLIKM